MSLVNILDDRTNPYNVMCDAVLEASCHDNGITEASIFDNDNEGFVESFNNISLSQAIKHATLANGCVTIFLYDVDSGAIPKII